MSHVHVFKALATASDGVEVLDNCLLYMRFRSNSLYQFVRVMSWKCVTYTGSVDGLHLQGF